MARVSLAGGAPREVLDEVSWADWTPDGSDLAIVRGGYQSHLEFPANKTIYQPQGWISHVRFSRQGDLLAFADHLPTGDDGRVVVVDREGKTKAASSFYTTVEGVAWSADGKEVWFAASPSGAARAIYAMNLKGKERLVLHVPGTLTLQDIARDGRVLLTEDNTQIQILRWKHTFSSGSGNPGSIRSQRCCISSRGQTGVPSSKRRHVLRWRPQSGARTNPLGDRA